MIKITKSDFTHLGKPQSVQSTSMGKVGVTSKQLIEKSTAKFRSESALTDVNNSGTKMSTETSIGIDLQPLLGGLAPNEEQGLYRIYRDMYYVDPIAGSAADLMSTLPFGDFSLGGIDPDKKFAKVSQTFSETLEKLNVKNLMPELAIDFLVMGNFTGSILMNEAKTKFTGIMAHDSENCTFQPLPFYNQDPIITVRFPPNLIETLKGDGKRVNRLRKLLGNEVFNTIASGTLELDPTSTIHIPRKTFSTSQGVSWFHRLVPIYLFEKNLYRGTLVESARRQRGILHVTLDGGEDWQPTPADYEYVSELFTNADADPLGAIITTRSGIMTEELRQGGDFWKITDVWDTTTQFKLKALGLSEGMLNGEASLDTTSGAMLVFIQALMAFRDNITKKFFYDTLFPLISLVNGYTLDAKGKLRIDAGFYETNKNDVESVLDKLNDTTKLLIPNVQWSKHLKPEGDSAYIEMLDSLTQKGVPISIRALAAAGGFNIDDLLSQQDDDIAMRRSVGEYMAKLKAVQAQFAPADTGGSDDSGDDQTESDAEESESRVAAQILKVLDPALDNKMRSSVRKAGKPSILKRFESTGNEVTGTSKTGKKKMILDQRAANAKANDNIVKVVKDMKKKGQL